MMLMGIDNHGNRWDGIDPKRPKASLLEQMGAHTAAPMYRDLKDGRTVQTGYVVSQGRGFAECWVELFKVEPWEKRA